MKATTSKSKNSESFYIAKSYINNKGKSTSVNVRKLGTLNELLMEHGPTRDDVMKWAKQEARLETLKYKKEQQTKSVQITFHSDRKLDYGQQVFFRGGYLFPQSFYYRLQLDKTCRKLRDKHRFKYDINAILSDLIYARILEPASKLSSYTTASEFLEKPSYQIHDVYRALDILENECDLIQSEVYKNSHLIGTRNDKVLCYDCTNYFFEIEQEDGDKRYDRAWALDKAGFKRVSDDVPVNLSEIPEDDNGLYYKDEPYTPHTLHQRLIVTYSPKYARYQKAIRDAQVERAEKMLSSGKVKKERKNPNDPARFIGKAAVTDEGEAAKIHNYLDTDKIEQESLYDGMYAVTTDLLDDDVKDILKVSEGRWEIEECFRIMKTDFEARPVFLHNDTRIKAHFLICFLSLVIYRYLEKELGNAFTCETILNKLKTMNFADIEEQGFVPLYIRDKLTDTLHAACGFDTDFKFITKSQMKTIQKKSKGRV